MQSLHGQARTLKQSREIAGPVLRGSSSTLGLFRTCHRGAAHDGFTAHKTFERQELENRISSIRWWSWSAKQNTSSNTDGSQECSWELSWNQLIESRAINPEKSSNARTMQTFFHAIRGVLWDPNPLIRAERVLPAPIPLVPKEPALVSSCAGQQEAALRTRRSREVRIHCKLPCV